jgi:DNA repair exonuclease SbcCD ATPase subunit
MAGKLDEISEAIGRLRASVADIQRRTEEIRKLMERRHADSSAALRDLAEKLDKHAAAVETIRPTVAALELSRSKLATFGSLGIAAFVVVGWLVEAGVKLAVDRILAHLP